MDGVGRSKELGPKYHFKKSRQISVTHCAALNPEKLSDALISAIFSEDTALHGSSRETNVFRRFGRLHLTYIFLKKKTHRLSVHENK